MISKTMLQYKYVNLSKLLTFQWMYIENNNVTCSWGTSLIQWWYMYDNVYHTEKLYYNKLLLRVTSLWSHGHHLSFVGLPSLKDTHVFTFQCMQQ